MTGYSNLDELLALLNSLHISSGKTLDSFADTSKTISNRARRIAAKVQPWETAQENIASTIEEMSRAARCYHPPPALRQVLARKEKNPEVLCKCLDYLVFTENYLATHPSNPYGDQIKANISTQLASVVRFAEDIVKEAFIISMQKKRERSWKPDEGKWREAATDATTATATVTTTTATELICDPDALVNIDKVVRRLGENFDRTNVVAGDVKELLAEGMQRHVSSLFESSSYGKEDEEMQPYHQMTARRGSLLVRKHYQKGTHRLLAISKSSRQLVSEVAECLDKYVVRPLNNSPVVLEMPGNLGILVFDIIKEKCFDAIKIDKAAFSDPTHMFVLSRGEGIGLWGEKRHFREAIFIGLDFVEELWMWKNLAEKLSGESQAFKDHVDGIIELFLYEMKELLDGYVNCKGMLHAKRLKELTNNLNRTEWLPSLDCTAHMSATNQVYLHKVMLTNYFGAVKLALYGSLLNPLAEEEALRELESYMMRCVSGTLQDLETIAEVALELQVDSALREAYLGSPAVFMLNNISFLIESYRKEACFTQRRVSLGNSESVIKSEKKLLKDTLSSVPIAENIIATLKSEQGHFVEEFALSWSKCFPPVNSNSELAGIGPDTGELRKSERMAVKHWYRDVAAALTKKISASANFVVLDPSQRNALIEASVAAVRNGFREFEAVLGGRSWSNRPLKWMLHEVDEWENMLSKSF